MIVRNSRIKTNRQKRRVADFYLKLLNK